MPWVVAAAAVVGAAAAVKGSIDANKAAKSNDAYNAEIERLQTQYRADVINYNNYNYANEVDFFQKQIAWEEDEFGKNTERAFDNVDIANEDFFGKLSVQMKRVVEQDIAETFNLIAVDKQVRLEGGAVEARLADAGISGNTANALRGDVSRQGGEAKFLTSANAEAARNQSILETRGLKTAHSAQLSGISIPTYQPLQGPAVPAPVSPVNPTAPSARIGSGTIALNAVSSGINLAVGVNNLGTGLKLW